MEKVFVDYVGLSLAVWVMDVTPTRMIFEELGPLWT